MIAFFSFKSLSPALNNTQKIIKACQNEINKEICYSNQFDKLTSKVSFNLAYQTLFDLQELDHSTRNCHLIAHTISVNETKKNPEAWQQLLSKVDPNNCNGGFIHGVIEAKDEIDPNFVLDETTIPEICRQVKQLNGAEEATCVHIMGHLVLLNTQGDLNKALDICLQLPIEHHNRCLGGVFMEYELKDNLVSHGLAFPPQWTEQTIVQQENICQQFSGKLSTACWRELSRILVIVYPNNPQKIYENCLKSPEKEGALDCYNHSMGFLAIADNIDQDDLKPLCGSVAFDGYYFLRCLHYMNSFMLLNSLKFIDRTIFVCQNVPERLKISCFNILAQNIKKIADPTQLPNLCNQIPKASRNYCHPD